MGERIVIGNKYEYWTNQRLVRGSFTEIFQVKNIITQQDYALKIIKQSNYRADIYEQVCMQGKILMVLKEASKKDICPFINKIEEYLETSNNNIYIILELCNQGNLQQKIKKEKRLPENETLHILYQLLQALVLLAKNNVAHRNIKPENIFIKDGIYKLEASQWLNKIQSMKQREELYHIWLLKFLQMINMIKKQMFGPQGCLFMKYFLKRYILVEKTLKKSKREFQLESIIQMIKNMQFQMNQRIY